MDIKKIFSNKVSKWILVGVVILGSLWLLFRMF